MPRLALYLLGAPGIERDGVPVRIRRRKVFALFVYLAVRGQRHSRDALATIFWPEHDQSQARAELRRVLSSLKKSLGEGYLDVDREAVGVAGDAEVWLDVDEFQARLAECQAHGHPEEEICPACLSSLSEAVALYRDDFLAGFSLRDSPGFDDWQFFQTEGLRQELARALERLVCGHTAQGAHELAIPHARRWLALDPLHEPAHRHLMQLYAQTDQRAAALRQYQECARILEAELGLPPSEETTFLYEQLCTRTADREESLLPAAQPRHNLPTQLTSFIGREPHLAAVWQQLTRPEVRLLTLTGSGGTGKTRLSLQVAAEQRDEFEDGVFFVPLAPIRDPALVVPIIARTLGIHEFGGRPLLESLKDHLRDKHMLLVLDNFEHVAPAAPLVSDLLATAARLKVLVTSRASLRAYGEHEYLVPPMATADSQALPPLERLAQVEAVQLFIQRARAVKADFALTEENAPAVVEICVRLEGLPLAIELAAARVRVLPPQKMLPRLDSRLGFLTGGARDLPARQQTLRGAIDWSYDLLAADEKTLFRRLAVFVGGCTLEAAEAVINISGELDVLSGLEGLVDKSLLQDSEVDGQSRFRMLETIREYALERLAASGGEEEGAIRGGHARFFLGLAEEAEPQLAGPEQVAWLNRLEMEHDNLRAALAWSIENAVDVGMRLAGALGTFWRVRGYHSEGRDWLAKALAESQAGSAGTDNYRAKALNSAGKLALFQGDTAAAYSLQEESVALWHKLGDRRGLAYALRELAPAAWRQGDLTQALTAIEGSVALFQQMEDKPGLAGAVFWQGYLSYIVGDYERGRSIAMRCVSLAQEIGDINREARSTLILGHIAFRQGDYAAAQPFYEKSLALFRKARDQYGISALLTGLGDLWYVQGNYACARTFYAEGLEISQAMGNRSAVAQMLCRLGGVSFHLNGWREGRALLAESLRRWRELGDKRGIAGCLVELAGVYVEEQPERAARLLGTARAFLEAGDTYPPPTLQAEIRADYDRNLAVVRTRLDQAAFTAAWTEGRVQDLETAVVELLVELGE
jgi:predicted ATPase/DNA-binding SARP family transcriptional activator